MRLAKIIYEIFESDAQRLDADSPQIHEIDREIHLIDEEGESTFISWCPDPVQFAVGISSVSFFDQPIPITRDMGDSELWKDLIGEDVTLNFEDTDHQVLKIGSGDQAVYCWTSGLDILFVSKQKP